MIWLITKPRPGLRLTPGSAFAFCYQHAAPALRTGFYVRDFGAGR